MNAFFQNKNDRSKSPPPVPPTVRPATLTDAQLAKALYRARRMRSRLFRLMLRRIWRGFSGSSAPRRTATLKPGLDDHLVSALTAIRSSAELLRDNPDIAPAERRRFADIVLKEEARLEILIAKLLNPSRSIRH